MKKTIRVLSTVALGAAFVVSAVPARAQFAGPIPVQDVGPVEQHTWFAQLVQQIAIEAHQVQSVELQIQNVLPTRFSWGTSGSGIGAVEPLLESALGRVTSMQRTETAQNGVPVAPNAALAAAQAGMEQIPEEQADVTNAQAASDDAQGDLSAQQATHRFNALQVTEGQKLRQFLYAQQLQNTAEEEEAARWMTDSGPDTAPTSTLPTFGAGT